MVKNLRTFLSLSRNCFWLITLPPPKDFSMNCFISLSLGLATLILELAKGSDGAC
jgi:hypothetical protein